MLLAYNKTNPVIQRCWLYRYGSIRKSEKQIWDLGQSTVLLQYICYLYRTSNGNISKIECYIYEGIKISWFHLTVFKPFAI